MGGPGIPGCDAVACGIGLGVFDAFFSVWSFFLVGWVDGIGGVGAGEKGLDDGGVDLTLAGRRG